MKQITVTMKAPKRCRRCRGTGSPDNPLKKVGDLKAEPGEWEHAHPCFPMIIPEIERRTYFIPLPQIPVNLPEYHIGHDLELYIPDYATRRMRLWKAIVHAHKITE